MFQIVCNAHGAEWLRCTAEDCKKYARGEGGVCTAHGAEKAQLQDAPKKIAEFVLLMERKAPNAPKRIAQTKL